MDWESFRLSRRLLLPGSVSERVYGLLAEIDAIKGGWRLANRLLPQTIERLTQSVLVTSTGASNRIEGNRLTDAEVEALYRNLRIRRFASRDEQEVAGYIEVLHRIFESYADIPVKETAILQLHRDMLAYSDKDRSHAGTWKFGSNRVEAKDTSGNVIGVIFDPTPPHLVPKEMQELCDWYAWASAEQFRPPLILTANFVFEYLAIHPFQDGNGRTSRLLTNLLLLRHGYDFARVVSHEKLVEENKGDYYLALNRAQASWKTPSEDVSPWLLFFLDMIRRQANEAASLLEADQIEGVLSGKQAALWAWANGQADRTFSRKMAVEALGFPPRTVEAIIKKLVGLRRLERIGEGRATRYRVVSG